MAAFIGYSASNSGIQAAAPGRFFSSQPASLAFVSSSFLIARDFVTALLNTSESKLALVMVVNSPYMMNRPVSISISTPAPAAVSAAQDRPLRA